MKKLVAAMAVALSLTALELTGYAQSGAETSTEAIAENLMVLILAHGPSETHTIHTVMTGFADEAEERTNGRIQVRILPNGRLGSRNESMEQLMAGVIFTTKISAPGLVTCNESYHIFGLSYIFDDTGDFYHVVDSGQMQDFFLSSSDDGFVALTYYTSGAHSFYTKSKVIHMPAGLKGLKIRMRNTKSQTDMMKALDGILVTMFYGDICTSLQTGIIDDIGNDEAVLTIDKHDEICKVCSTDRHAMIPGIIVMSAKVWKATSPQDQQIILKAAREPTESHKIAWDAAIDKAIQEASTQMGVEFVSDADKDAFRQATSGMIDECCVQYPGVKELLGIIDSVK